MPKGAKTCPNCGTSCGPRSFTCKNCSHSFQFKPACFKPKRGEQIDWKSLEPGDKIKVIQGSGPYMPLSNGDKSHIGYSGEFVVTSLENDGINATGNKEEGRSSYCFIYMGNSYLSKKSGVQREPHKIELLQKDNGEVTTPRTQRRRTVRRK